MKYAIDKTGKHSITEQWRTISASSSGSLREKAFTLRNNNWLLVEEKRSSTDFFFRIFATKSVCIEVHD